MLTGDMWLSDCHAIERTILTDDISTEKQDPDHSDIHRGNPVADLSGIFAKYHVIWIVPGTLFEIFVVSHKQQPSQQGFCKQTRFRPTEAW